MRRCFWVSCCVCCFSIPFSSSSSSSSSSWWVVVCGGDARAEAVAKTRNLIRGLVGYGGDARAEAVAKTRNLFRGLVGAASKQNATGKTKQQAPAGGSDYLTPCPRNTSSTSPPQQGPAFGSATQHSTARAAGDGGEGTLMPDCLCN